MPSLVPSRRPHSSTGTEEDEQSTARDTGRPNNGDGDSPVSDASSMTRASEDVQPPAGRSSKRVRLSSESTARQTTSPPLANSVSRRSTSISTATLTERSRAVAPRSARAEHQPGAIVRVTLKNFVTYTAAAFYPGPSLNMVIGPNGTGKSTLVCAICLGLGWGPGLLGRSKEIGEFVKHGYDEAMVEIELKGRAGSKRNPVIKRTIKRENNTTRWTLNGSNATLRQVMEVVHGYSIQIDNLCQFLPQDRVVSFAQLTPVELLASTVRAAAPPYMAEWHEDLKKLRREQREHEKAATSLTQNLSNLEARQATQQADVDRMRERAQVVDTVRKLHKCMPRALWMLARIKMSELTPKLRAVEAEIRTLQSETGPAMTAIRDRTKYKEKIERVVRLKQQLTSALQNEVERHKSDHQSLEKEIEDCRKKVEAEKSGGKERKSEMARILNKIKVYKVLLRHKPPDFDAAAYNEQIRGKERQIRTLKLDADTHREAIREYNTQIEQDQSRIASAETNIEQLNTQAGKQERKLFDLSRETAAAWKWVREHKSGFEGDVFGPPLVECTVPDARYIGQLEACLQRGEFLAFTVTNRADFEKLSDQLYNVMKLGDITLRSSQRPLDSFKPPVEGDMQQFGLDGWAIDYLHGPEQVKAMLCAEAKLHATGIGLRDGGDRQFQQIQASPITNWVTSTSSYQITRRREYGPDATSTRTRDVPVAKYWTNQSVDSAASESVRGQINEWKVDVEMRQRKVDEEKQLIQGINSQIRDLENEKTEILAEKETKQKDYAEYNATPSKIKMQEENLAQMQANEQQLQQRLDEINEEQTSLALRKAQVAIDYGKKTEKYCDVHAELVTAAIALIEASSDLETLTERNHEVLKGIEQKKAEHRELKKQTEECKAEGKRRIDEVKAAYEAEPDLEEFFRNLPQAEQERTPDELNAEIEAQKARLDLLHEGNPGAIEEFEQRAVRIETLRAKVGEVQGKLDAQQREMDTIRGRWEPELDGLVASISDAFAASFAKIECAGAVSVYKDGEGGRDFENWAVQIQVKFREQEAMSILDSHRQSGGERAVSTIFYLMALQSLSRAPFRVVDEINQGMDPRNERKVHERLVDIACGNLDEPDDRDYASGSAAAAVQPGSGSGSGSQYFLITPKLLTGLKYSPGMTVHCIASGDYMPADYDQLDFRGLLDKARSLVRAAA